MDHFFTLNFWEMTLRTLFSFFTLLILARILGKKQLGQLIIVTHNKELIIKEMIIK